MSAIQQTKARLGALSPSEQYLFVVDVDGSPDKVPARQVFSSFSEAVQFIGKQRVRLSVFASPVGTRSNDTYSGTVSEAYASDRTGAFMLRFMDEPDVFVKGGVPVTPTDFEVFSRVFPTA